MGHLTRVLSLFEEIVESDTNVCLHGPIVVNSKIKALLHQSGVAKVCRCSEKADVLIWDSYENEDFSKVFHNLKIQIIDEASKIHPADGYIEGSPIMNNKLTRTLPIFEFKNSPMLRKSITSQYEARNLKLSDIFLYKEDIKILILLGGSNQQNHIDLITSSFYSSDNRLKFFTPLSKTNSKKNGISKRVQEIKFEANLASLVKNFDIVLSAAGMTSWELIALGIPGAIFPIVDNQNYQFEYLVSNNLFFGVSLTSKKIININDYIKELSISKRSRKLIDINTPTKIFDWILSNFF